MNPAAQGIPGLPDLTHPHELVQFGTQALKGSLLFVFLVIALGIAIALVKNPFGVFTNTAPVRNTGIIPRLLMKFQL